MVRIEAPCLQLAVIGLRLRREGEKPPEELMIAGLFALFQERFGVIGVFDILEPIVPSGMAGDKLLAAIEAEPVGGSFERQDLAGIVGRDRIVVRLERDAKLPGGPHLGHGGNIKRMQREGAQRRLFFVP